MELHDQLTEAILLLKEHDRVVNQIQISKNMLKKEKERLDILNKKMLNEKMDVKRLDRFNLINFWHTLKSTKDIIKQKEHE